jgi:hypothetical protein
VAEIFNEKQIRTILDDVESTTNLAYFGTMINRAHSVYTPPFFKPYRSFSELGHDLGTTIIEPIKFGGIAASATFAAFISLTCCAGSLLISGAASIFLNTSLRDEAFNTACKAWNFLGSALLTAATSLLLMIISIPHSLASLVTRSSATIVSAFSNLESSSVKVEYDDKVDYQPSLSYGQ